jgi:molybdopterin synthase sulfur carrier subunit
MTVTVKFFAALRERIGTDTIAFDIDGRMDSDRVLGVLRDRLGEQLAAQLVAPDIRVALNKEFVDYPWSVDDGDEIAFMPPITGG